MRVMARRLTAEAFTPFGQVIPTRIPSLGRRAHVAALENRRTTATPNLAVSRLAPVPLPIRAMALERHPFSSPTLLPTDLARHVVAVWSADAAGQPLVERLLGLVAHVAQGVDCAPRTRDHPIT